jgi:hypothetical protein
MKYADYLWAIVINPALNVAHLLSEGMCTFIIKNMDGMNKAHQW